MNTPKQTKQQRGNDIERAFLKILRVAKRKLAFAPVTVDSLEDRMLNALIQAAVSRCIDFNMTANRLSGRAEEAFFLVSNLRGICEDLIYLTYLCRMEQEQAKELVRILVRKNTAEGLVVQRKFFDTNNPFQPVLGGHSSVLDEQKARCRTEYRRFWASLGISRHGGPTIQEMAARVGLTSTYDFIYFAASNFVHFNPQVLFRTGWGDVEGPMVFSIRHMHRYYRSFCSFYGAVLFVGFEASFGTDYFETALDNEIDRLVDLIGNVQRWPEVITFEEMNETPPLYLLTHALGRVVREDDETVPYGATATTTGPSSTGCRSGGICSRDASSCVTASASKSSARCSTPSSRRAGSTSCARRPTDIWRCPWTSCAITTRG